MYGTGALQRNFRDNKRGNNKSNKNENEEEEKRKDNFEQ